jgi:hypothetical protein
VKADTFEARQQIETLVILDGGVDIGGKSEIGGLVFVRQSAHDSQIFLRSMKLFIIRKLNVFIKFININIYFYIYLYLFLYLFYIYLYLFLYL